MFPVMIVKSEFVSAKEHGHRVLTNLAVNLAKGRSDSVTVWCPEQSRG